MEVRKIESSWPFHQLSLRNFNWFCLCERLVKEVSIFVVFLSVTVKTWLIEKKLQHLYGHFQSELVKLTLCGHTNFEGDSVPFTIYLFTLSIIGSMKKTHTPDRVTAALPDLI